MIRGAAIAVVLAAATPADAKPGDRWDGGTVAEQAGGGLISGVVLGAATGLAGGLLGSALGSKGNWGAPLAGALLGFGIGAIVGSVWAVDHFGDDRGQDGSGLATTIGEIGGIGLFAVIETMFAKARVRVPAPAHFALAITTTLGGAIVGYQSSSSRHGTTNVPLVGFVF